MIIRHGEKPPESGLEPYGITSDGTRDSNALTPFGWARAGALVEPFAPFRSSAPAGLMRPQAVFASRPEAGRNLRESETVSLVARRLGVPVEMPYVVGQEAELAATLCSCGGLILVAWNHTRIPDIPEHLGTVRPRVPPTWPDERFDMVYVLQGSGPGTYALIALTSSGDGASFGDRIVGPPALAIVRREAPPGSQGARRPGQVVVGQFE